MPLRPRFAFAVAALAASLCWLLPSAAIAQNKKKKDKEAPAKQDDAAAPADGAAAAEGQPTEPTPEQIEATKAFNEGKALAEQKQYEQAIAKFQEAYELFPDAGLQYVIGEAYQLWGNELVETDRPAAFERYRQSMEAYRRFLELVPESPIAAQVQQRVTDLETSLANEEQRIESERLAAEAAKQEAAEAKRQEEEERLRALEAKQGTQVALHAMVQGGADQQLSALLRMMAGGMVGWNRFVFEGHLGLDGFLRVDSDKGVSARSYSLDLGMRYGLGEDRFVGPFVAGGGSFGFFGGKPRERKLSDDQDTCGAVMTTEPGTCSFQIDKSIAARLGVGYGFLASDNTTVAVRLDLQYWLFSVDDEQPSGSPPAALVEKPQSALAVLLGLEFMLWK